MPYLCKSMGNSPVITVLICALPAIVLKTPRCTCRFPSLVDFYIKPGNSLLCGGIPSGANKFPAVGWNPPQVVELAFVGPACPKAPIPAPAPAPAPTAGKPTSCPDVSWRVLSFSAHELWLVRFDFSSGWIGWVSVTNREQSA